MKTKEEEGGSEEDQHTQAALVDRLVQKQTGSRDRVRK
jgi:hypothetical protein